MHYKKEEQALTKKEQLAQKRLQKEAKRVEVLKRQQTQQMIFAGIISIIVIFILVGV